MLVSPQSEMFCVRSLHSVQHFSYFSYVRFVGKLKLRLKNTIRDKTLTYASENWTRTKRERKQLNFFERKV